MEEYRILNKIYVIDLLNMIARGKSKPQKIIIKGDIDITFELDEFCLDYFDEDGESLFETYAFLEMLNDEVEIIQR